MYSMGRSGGGTVIKFFELLTHLNYSFYEPFKDGYFEKGKKIEKYIDEIKGYFENKSGVIFKHNLENLDYLKRKKTFEIEKWLFDNFNKVLINGRSNWLKHAISEIISAKTGNWHQKHELNEISESIHVDLSYIENFIKKRKRKWDKNISYIEKSKNIDFVRVNYENFFGDVDLHSRVEYLENITKNFFEISLRKNHNIRKIYELLSPRYKINNKTTYKIISNIKIINKKLGKKYGFLF